MPKEKATLQTPDITIEEPTQVKQPDITVGDYLAEEVRRKQAAEQESMWRNVPESERQKA